MSDRGAVALAVATALGALAARSVPLAVAGGAVALALALRRPALLCVGAALLASGLGARSWAGLTPPAPAAVQGTATVVTDPAEVAGAVRAELRLRLPGGGVRRVEAWARGRAAAGLASRLAGEKVAVAGRLGPVGPAARARLARRHVAARLVLERAEAAPGGDPVSRFANGLRRLLVRGAAPLPEDQRALFAGFVLGDDRDQSEATAEEFRAAGLSHLLAVSGQNVAFVLALVRPALARLGRWARLGAGFGVLGAFGVLTRFEPSVLRAGAMAALAMVAFATGRPASSLRLLALAVAALLLVDPLLVGSVGFGLSVGASAGIALLAAPLAARLPGPRPLASALAVTLAAQAGVAPVLVPVFGGLPVAAVPANLAAAPAAGPIVAWGLAAGPVAGALGEPVATWLHLPTRLLVGWVAAVAREAAGLPLGTLGPAHVGWLAVLAVGCALGRRCRPWRAGAALAAAAVLVAPAVASRPAARAELDGVALVDGARLWRAGGATVLVADDPASRPLLDALRRAGVRRLDVLVATRGGWRASSALYPLVERGRARLVLAPPDHRLGGAQVPAVGQRVAVGGLGLEVTALRPRLEVRVARAPPPG